MNELRDKIIMIVNESNDAFGISHTDLLNKCFDNTIGTYMLNKSIYDLADNDYIEKTHLGTSEHYKPTIKGAIHLQNGGFVGETTSAEEHKRYTKLSVKYSKWAAIAAILSAIFAAISIFTSLK